MKVIHQCDAFLLNSKQPVDVICKPRIFHDLFSYSDCPNMVFLGTSHNPRKEDVKQWWGKEAALSEADCEKTVVKRILFSKIRKNLEEKNPQKSINGTSRPGT